MLNIKSFFRALAIAKNKELLEISVKNHSEEEKSASETDNIEKKEKEEVAVVEKPNESISALTHSINHQFDSLLKGIFLLKLQSRHDRFDLAREHDGRRLEELGKQGRSRGQGHGKQGRSRTRSASLSNGNGHGNWDNKKEGTSSRDVTEEHLEVASRYGMNLLELLALLNVLNDGVPHRAQITLDELVQLLEDAEQGGRTVSYTDPETGDQVDLEITQAEFLRLIEHVKQSVPGGGSTTNSPNLNTPTAPVFSRPGESIPSSDEVPQSDEEAEELDKHAEEIADDIIGDIIEKSPDEEEIVEIINKVRDFLFRGTQATFPSGKELYLSSLKARQRKTYDHAVTNVFATTVQSHKKAMEQEDSTHRERTQRQTRDRQERERLLADTEEQLDKTSAWEYNIRVSAELVDNYEELDFSNDPLPLLTDKPDELNQNKI